MKQTRRGFLSLLASLPFMGLLASAPSVEPKDVPKAGGARRPKSIIVHFQEEQEVVFDHHPRTEIWDLGEMRWRPLTKSDAKAIQALHSRGRTVDSRRIRFRA